MPNLSGFNLSFDDEFSSDKLDTSKWTTQFPFNPTDHLSNETERYQNVGSAHDPFKEAGGALTITASPASDLGAGLYSSGRIGSEKSAFNFQAGTYIEARMQLPAGRDNGMWPAFWTAAKDTYWPPEMDVMEKVSSTSSGLGPTKYSYGSVTNSTNAAHFGSWRDAGTDLTNSYHTYGALWTADNKTLIEYFDGQEVARGAVPSDWAGHPMYVEANLAVGGTVSPADWAGPPDGKAHQLQIDYIRGYSVNQAAAAVQSVSSPDGGGLDFYGANVGSSPVTSALATATDTLVVRLSEDAWQGDAQCVISIDGKTVGGTVTVTASHAKGQSQAVTLAGQWGAGAHDVGVRFLNDAWGGTAAADRNLYVERVVLDGQVAKMAAPVAQLANGTAHVATGASPLVLQLSEDAYGGHAQFTVAVDGKTLGLAQTVTASHAKGAAQNFAFAQAMAAGTHDVAVSFLNDAYGGSAAADRNLYVQGITANGAAMPGAAASILGTATQHFTITVPAAS